MLPSTPTSTPNTGALEALNFEGTNEVEIDVVFSDPTLNRIVGHGRAGVDGQPKQHGQPSTCRHIAELLDNPGLADTRLAPYF